jgi:hypothetical protein
MNRGTLTTILVALAYLAVGLVLIEIGIWMGYISIVMEWYP